MKSELATKYAKNLKFRSAALNISYMFKLRSATLSALCLSAILAFGADFEVTPKVNLESGYATKVTYLGLENQKSSMYASAEVALENNFLTPTVGATYFFKGEAEDQTVLDISVARVFQNDFAGVGLTVGGQKRILQSQPDNLLGYATLRLEKLWILTKLANPYVSVGKDFDADLFGVTVGLDRKFSIGRLDLNPYAEMYIYDNYKSYKAGGTIAYNVFKYTKPFVDVSYVTNEDSVLSRRLDGEVLATAGITFSF